MAKRKREREFLSWCHEQGGPCCVCGRPFEELHHWAPSGMGQRGTDWRVVRLCRGCHAEHGQRESGLRKRGKFDILDAYWADNCELLIGWLDRGRR